MRETFTAMVRENTVEEPYDGGRLVIHCDDTDVKQAGWLQCEVILNSATDDKLAQFPSTRVDKVNRKFRVTVEEIV